MQNSKAVAIIANPKAGYGLSLEKLREARRVLWGRRYEFFVPENPEGLIHACSNLDPERYEAVVVLGGDGSQNLAIRALTTGPARGIPLYPFPVGTANDLASEMGTTSRWEDVEELIHEGRTERIDLVRVNGIPFATVAGIGIGACLTAELNDRRQRSRVLKMGLRYMGAPIYSALTLKTIVSKPRLEREYLLDSGNLRQKIRSAAIFVGNQGTLGAQLRVSHSADNSDNRFAVLAATSMSRARLISSLSQMQNGIVPKGFISFSASQLTIESCDAKPIPVFGDGEMLLEESRLAFEILPRELPVYRGRKGGKDS